MSVHNFTPLHGRTFETKPSAVDELLALQLEQFQHDEMYHREIARLTVQHRLNHMVLHLAKYAGQFANEAEADGEKLDRAIIDGIIIGLSTANILNLRLSDKLVPFNQRSVDLTALCRHFATLTKAEAFDRTTFVKRTIVAVGRMAKGCESVDHLEAFPFREAITDGLVDILTTLLASTASREIDVATAIRERLSAVKAKSIFHGLI